MSRIYKKIKVLIINVSFDPSRIYEPRRFNTPRAMAPYYLAGALNREKFDIKIYCEVYHGKINDTNIFYWPNLVCLTGLSHCFDRMLHIFAYIKTINPNVTVVAGGYAVTAAPVTSLRVFDTVINGDIESFRDYIINKYGEDFAQENIVPRYDLLENNNLISYIETSRNCNFSCSFCTAGIINNKIIQYDIDYIKKQIESINNTKILMIIDNNFYGNNRDKFIEKLKILNFYRKIGKFIGWIGLVSSDFFSNDENIKLIGNSGCMGIFTGIETINRDIINYYNKKQNLIGSTQVISEQCARNGIVINYGMMINPSLMTIESILCEFNNLLHTPGLPAPSFISLTVPIKGTEEFNRAIKNRDFLPNVSLRDMDGRTIITWTKNDLWDVAENLHKINSLQINKKEWIKKTINIAVCTKYKYSMLQRSVIVSQFFHTYYLKRNINDNFLKNRYPVSTVSKIDSIYNPIINVDQKYEHLFKVTYVTDRDGNAIDI